MAVTRSQIASNSATGTSVDITLAASPGAGRLLIITHYAAGAVDQSTMAGPAGWTKVVGPLSGTNSGAAIYTKVATGSEGTGPFTVTSVTGTAVFNVAQYTEWDAGATWASAAADATGRHTSSVAGTTVTTTADAASTQAVEFAIVAVGLNGTGTFADTWTGGFTTLGASVGSRLNSASKETTATETFSTTETWVTSRTPRSAVASFPIPSGGGPTTLQPPANFTGTIVSSTQIDLSWTAASGAVGYTLERDGAIIANRYAGTAYSDTGLAPSTLYVYRIRSVG